MIMQITLFLLVTSQEEISNSRMFDFLMYELNMFLQTSLLSSLMLDGHTDCKNILFFRVQTEYVFSNFPDS